MTPITTPCIFRNRSTWTPARGQATRYQGGFSYYVRERESRALRHEAARKNIARERERIQRFIDRFRAKNTKATQVQSRIKALEKMPEVELEPALSAVSLLRVASPQRSGTEVARLENAGVTYDDRRWVLRNVDLSVRRGERIALVGFNGLGKTTLLRVLAGQREPSEGRRVL